METDKLIYWAGFFDGQGHVELAYANPTSASPQGRYSFQVWINQWSKAPNEFFGELAANFGGRVIPSDKSSWPYNARWYASGTSARSFLESILPYLRKKKRAAELGVDLQKRMANNRSKPLTESEIKVRDAILEEYFSLILGNNPSRRMRKLGSDARRSFENGDMRELVKLPDELLRQKSEPGVLPLGQRSRGGDQGLRKKAEMPIDKTEKQYLIFLKYTRQYLSQATGYSRGYISKIVSGSKPLSEVIIARCCHALNEPAEVLFQLVEPHAPRMPPPKSERQDLLETVAELEARLTRAEKEPEGIKSELRQYQ